MRAYRAMVRSWHDASRLAAPTTTADGRYVLRLLNLNSRQRAEVVGTNAQGGFDADARAQFERILGDTRTHERHDIDPRLMDLLYQVAVHFQARQLSVLSGYRSNSGRSNHAIGRAVDFLIPGVSDRDLSAYAARFPNVGVGRYPTSGFVHLDVRDYNTTWIDDSGPGRRPRYRHAHRRHHRRHGRAERAARS